jgi:hypothetical protein
MSRYAIIIAIFIVLTGYVLYKAHLGHISAKFRTVTLVLLSLLLLLSGIGLYVNLKYYSFESQEQEFASQKQEIIARMKEYYKEGKYNKARELGESYKQVRDEDLRYWYEKSLEKDLAQKASSLSSKEPEQAISIYKRLWKLTSKTEYQDKLQKLQERIKKNQESLLLEKLDSISEDRLGSRFWVFKQLLELYPENAAYRQQFESLKMKIKQKIQQSPWTDVCSSSDTKFCKHIGMLAISEMQGGNKDKENIWGEILGVSWRAKGTLVNRSGELAPENAYYYIIDNQKQLILKKCAIIKVRNLKLEAQKAAQNE